MTESEKRELPTISLVLLILFASILLPLAWVKAQSSTTNPPKCCLPRVINFSKSTSNTWAYSAGFKDSTNYSMFVTSDGRGFSGITDEPAITEVPAAVPIEVLVAKTNGHPFNASCSSPNFTGNPSVDFACYISAARAQNYPYAVGKD